MAGGGDTPLHWLEEPMPVYTDASAWRDLSRMCPIPLAGGENITGDAEFAKASMHGQILVNSLFTLGFVVGVYVGDTTLGTTLGNLGFDETTFPNPVFIGDTLTASTTIIDKRESTSKPD